MNITNSMNVSDLVMKTAWPSDLSYTVAASTQITDTQIKNWITDHANEVEDLIKTGKERKEKAKLQCTQWENKMLRSRIKHVNFSGDTCIVYWNDDTTTKSRWDHSEPYDPEKAILAAIARKYYNNTNIYCEVLQKYAQDGWDHYHHYYDYLCHDFDKYVASADAATVNDDGADGLDAWKRLMKQVLGDTPAEISEDIEDDEEDDWL